jgi:GNAT superfamily N-acetyltransferase
MASVHMPAVKTVTISQPMRRRGAFWDAEETAMNLPFDWTIRSATPSDAGAIATLIRGCWPDDTPDSERIARLIGNGRCTLCACAGESCVGFVDAFETTDPFGNRRWEVDLVSVDASARGKGIGKGLVAASNRAAPDDLHLARGLVRVGNTAAERSFAAAGFRPEPALRTLCVATPQELPAQPEPVSAVTVHTLTYSGLWMESPLALYDLLAGRGKAAELGLGRVGTFALDAAGEAVCREAGYEAAGVFRWWLRAV